MAPALRPVRSEGDILPAWRDTPVGELLRAHNLGATLPAPACPALLVARCLEHGGALRLPEGFAISVHTGAARLKRVPFKVSWAIGCGGIRAIALVGHEGCTFPGITAGREQFIERLMTAGGWERRAAEQHFDHWADLFEIDEPAAAVLAEAARLRSRYPALPVASLLWQENSGLLVQVVNGTAD